MFKLSFIVIPLHVGTYSGTKCRASKYHGATWIQTYNTINLYTTNLLTDLTKYTIYKCLPYTTKDKRYKIQTIRMLHINTVHVQRETLWVKQLAGEQYKMIVVHEHVNIHISLSLLWDCVHTAVCEKCLVHRGECVTTGGLYRPTHLCAGAPLRILGPLDSIFTGALLRSGGGGGGGLYIIEIAIAFPSQSFFPLLSNQIILFQLLKSFSFVCNGKVIIFRFVFL